MQLVFLSIRRRDTLLLQEGVCRELLVCLDDLLEVVHHDIRAACAASAIWLDRAVACAMLVPFVLPEVIVVSAVVEPEIVHLRIQCRLSGCENRGRDVVQLHASIAELRVGAITMVRPETMKCPRILMPFVRREVLVGVSDVMSD